MFLHTWNTNFLFTGNSSNLVTVDELYESLGEITQKISKYPQRKGSEIDEDSLDFRSWLYLFCARCHGRDDTPSWEPPGWKKACPQPFCPTYRKFARILCLFLLGLLLWGIVYSILGEDAAPGGPLFGLAALCIAAHFGGWLISLTTLPALIGMLMTGIILQNVGWVSIDGRYSIVVSNVR